MFLAMESTNVVVELGRSIVFRGKADIVIQKNSPTVVSVVALSFMYEGEAEVHYSAVYGALVVAI